MAQRAQIPIQDKVTEELHRPTQKTLKKIDVDSLRKSRLFQYGYAFGLSKDIPNKEYELYIYKIMKDFGDVIQNTDIMMPYNQETRNLLFEELNKFYNNIGLITQNHGKQWLEYHRLQNMIESMLISYLNIDPKLSYYIKANFSKSDMRKIHLRIYAEMYSKYFEKTYPDVKIRGSYKPKDYGDTYIKDELQNYYFEDFAELAHRLHSVTKRPSTLKDAEEVLNLDQYLGNTDYTEIIKTEMQDLAFYSSAPKGLRVKTPTFRWVAFS